MSRIGKKPVPLPEKVEVKIAEHEIHVKGPKGELKMAVPDGIHVVNENGTLLVQRAANRYAAFHGLVRSLLFNCVTGVSQGFQKDLEIVGIGYRAEIKGNVVTFSLGYSHLIEYVIPEGIQVAVDKQTRLSVRGIDRQQVGQVAATIRSLRPPDPYKNKGIRYAGEVLKKKVGKAGATGAQ